MSENGSERSKMFERKSMMIQTQVDPAYQGRMRTRDEGRDWFRKQEIHLKAGHVTIMRKWKWLFVKGCEYRHKCSPRRSI